MYLDWKTQDERDVYVIDIEGNDLLPGLHTIWCMCWQNAKTKETGDCIGHDEIKAWFKERDKNTIYVGHNILRFDAVALNMILSINLSVGQLIDTLVLSQLYSPNIIGGHSLDEWGVRLGNNKGTFSDWSRFSEEMLSYCRQDVALTTELFIRLTRTLSKIGFTEKSCWIQHRFMALLDKQRSNGFYFNFDKALEFYKELRSIEKELEEEVHKHFPPIRVFVATRSKTVKNGNYSAIYIKDKDRYEIEFLPGNLYNAYEYQEFNLGSPKQRLDKLEELGWVSEADDPKTKTGNPKPFEKGELAPSLERFLEKNDIPSVRLIAKWMIVNGRANMVNTWLENYNHETGCIHGKLYVADTLRLRHQAPNTANIPSVRVAKDKTVLKGEAGQWSYESRDLWIARPGRVLVGTDAAGLELRMLAHYLNRPSFTEQVVEGDPHQYNADLVGIPRPSAKTVIYATMYGASGKKIAATLGVSNKEGEEIKEMFLEKLGLKDLIESVQHEQKTGRITLIDESQVVCPSPHAALNYLLQGGGARVMALGAILLERVIQAEQMDSLKVGDIHDEWQYDVHPDWAEKHSERAVRAIRESGVLLNLHVPLDGESKIGLTWAETH